MLTIGILFGFMAAICQSLSYISSKAFLHKYSGENIRLLLISHSIMGFAAFIALPFVVGSSLPPFEKILLPLFGCAAFYMVAQASLFMALKTTEASRISPLLGLKIIFIAILSIIFLDKSFTIIQWAAVVIAIIAGVILNWSGTPPPWKSLLLILFACLGYSLSDINIKILIEHLYDSSLFLAALYAAIMAYCLCGFISVILLFFMKKPTFKMIKDTVPFTLFWSIAMISLFTCFAFVSVMLGNIIQSSRGIISIVIAVAIAKAGYEHIEKKITTAIFIRRIVAAILMVASIVMFVIN